MQFGDTSYLHLIYTSIAVLTIFFIWAGRRRRVLTERFAERGLTGAIAPGASRKRRLIKTLIIIVASSCAVICLARPQWGFEWEEVRRTGLDLLIAIDVSKSMLANDVKPNRVERSKFAVKDLLRKMNGDRIGLIAFSGSAFLQCPLTIDYNGFMLALDDLTVGTIPRGGTNIPSAIKEAIAATKGPDKKYRVLVIITDGENLEGDLDAAAKEAALAGIKIFTIGVGSAEGELIQTYTENGERVFLTDRDGTIVKTRLNEEPLKKIAIETGGSYVRATQAEFGLVLLYDKIISKLEKRDIESKMKKHYQERYQVFLAFAIALLLLEPLISERRRVVT